VSFILPPVSEPGVPLAIEASCLAGSSADRLGQWAFDPRPAHPHVRKSTTKSARAARKSRKFAHCKTLLRGGGCLDSIGCKTRLSEKLGERKSTEVYAANVPPIFPFFGKQILQTSCGRSTVSKRPDVSAATAAAFPRCNSFSWDQN
jgi:hypothetical protein